MKLDYDGSAGLAPLDPSGARQVSEARDDEEYWLKVKKRQSSLEFCPRNGQNPLRLRAASPFCRVPRHFPRLAGESLRKGKLKVENVESAARKRGSG